jgi:hypothetical protein
VNLLILPSAQEDLAEGFVFYEEQQAGLGVYFLDTLFWDIDSLTLYAGIHREVFGFHRLLSKRFPYAVYCSIQGEAVQVKAVLDCRRDAKWTRRKLHP